MVSDKSSVQGKSGGRARLKSSKNLPLNDELLDSLESTGEGILLPGTDSRWGRLHIQRVKNFPLSYEVSAATRARQRGQLLAFGKVSQLNPLKTITFFESEKEGKKIFFAQAKFPWLTKNTYTVKTSAGELLGAFDKDLGKSFGNAILTVATPQGTVAVGRDSNTAVNKARKLINFSALVTFSFFTENGQEALRVERGWGKLDPYLVSIPRLSNSTQIDWRVAASTAIGMDVLLSAYY
jgi:hypothetical protein